MAIISNSIAAVKKPNLDKKSIKGSVIDFEKLNFPSCIFFSSFDAIRPSKPMTIEAAIILYVKDQPFISANIKANEVAKMIASLQPNW